MKTDSTSKKHAAGIAQMISERQPDNRARTPGHRRIHQRPRATYRRAAARTRPRSRHISASSTAQPPLASADTRHVRELRRVGKRIAIGLEGDLWLVLHLMIAGRLHWRPPAAKLAGRQSLASFDFPKGSLVLTEAGTKRRASLHVLAGAKRRFAPSIRAASTSFFH